MKGSPLAGPEGSPHGTVIPSVGGREAFTVWWDHCEHNSIPHTQEIWNCGDQGCRTEW